MGNTYQNSRITKIVTILSMVLAAFMFLFNKQVEAQSLNGYSFADSNMMTVAEENSESQGIPVHVSGVFGATSIYDHGSYFTAGVDLLTKPFPDDHFDVGLLGEIIWADHTEYITGLFLGYTISHDLPIMFNYTPSFLFVEGEQDFMHIVGVSYAYHLGELTLSPLVNLEFIHGHTNVMGGIGIGTHF